MLSAARARLRRCDREAGVTLIELLVSMGLATLLGAITLAMFVMVNNSSAATTDRTVSTAQARTALQAWTNYLRVADGPGAAGTAAHRIEWVTATDMLFYADLGTRTGSALPTPPTMIWLRLDTKKQLVEEQFAAPAGSTYPATYPTTATTCRIVATNVTSAAFSAYTSSASDTAFGTSLAPSGAGCLKLTGSVSQTDPVATATLAKVTSIGIDVVLSRSDGTEPLEFSTLATLPTLGGS